MASLINPGASVAFEVAYGVSALSVGMSVYDVTGGSATLVAGPTLMTETNNGCYRGYFTPVNNKIYHIIKQVYTDGTLTVLSPNYNPSSETVQAITVGSGGGGNTFQNVGPSMVIAMGSRRISALIQSHQIAIQATT